MLIRPTLEIPAVLRRAMEAYRANDPITVSESFEQHARHVTQFDAKLAQRLGVENARKPVEAVGAIGILKFYSHEMSLFDVTYLDVLSIMQAGRDVAAVCDWSVKMRGTGLEFQGRCHNIWTLDHTGRRIVDSRSVCKILTPNWDHELN